ncbi:MAG: tRNA-guanine transglycosylase, partial [Candidatus Bipolaricaulia bacterium]
GTVFLKEAPRFRINLRNARFKIDDRPIDSSCDCPTCRSHSRAYLRHLCRAGEVSFHRLATIHNLRFLVRMMRDIRSAIAEDRFGDLAADWGLAA